MHDNIKLRSFELTDLEKVMEINRRCLPENYSNYFYMDLYERFPESFIVAEVDGKVVGYIMCRIETGISDFKLIGISRKGHIISIAVLPEYRRQGIGYTLIQEAIKAMVQYKAKECYLEVRKSNTLAVNLYRKLGFEIIRTNHRYYADGEDAFKMGQKLPEQID